MPDEILVEIAAALAGRAATSLYELVRQTFSGRAEAGPVLEAAAGAAPESSEVAALAEELAHAERDDPAFAAELREEWATVTQHADRGGVTNHIGGSVSGKVVQARDIQGGVNF